jgi:broad specificity phosphatase PhoE
MKQHLFSLCFLLFVALPAVWAQAPLPDTASKLYFVRHGETLANETGDYSGDNQKFLSKLGVLQANRLVKKLQPYKFDRIAVSPADRTINTIAPYLRETKQKAEIWPALMECCFQKGDDQKIPALPEIKPSTNKIPLAPEHADVAFFANEESSFWLEVPNYLDGVNQARKAAADIETYLKVPGRQLLVVGHSKMGEQLFKILLPNEHIFPENGALTILRREGEGQYVPEMINGGKVAPKTVQPSAPKPELVPAAQ